MSGKHSTRVVVHRGHNPFSNQTGLSNFVTYSTMKTALTVNRKKTDDCHLQGNTSFSNDENYVVFLFVKHSIKLDKNLNLCLVFRGR